MNRDEFLAALDARANALIRLQEVIQEAIDNIEELSDEETDRKRQLERLLEAIREELNRLQVDRDALLARNPADTFTPLTEAEKEALKALLKKISDSTAVLNDSRKALELFSGAMQLATTVVTTVRSRVS